MRHAYTTLNFAFALSLFLFTGCYIDDDGGDPCAEITCLPGQVCSGGQCIDLIASSEEVKSGILPGNETWTADKIYVLASKVIVDAGSTLTIEAGTIIKGRQGTGSLASALIVARGAKIIAEGTPDNPIIFTSELDDIRVGEKSGTNLTAADNSKWGGVIILGHAKISAEDGDTEGQIEGIPANETYGRYGGSDDGDDSGVFRYVSIRHGGAEIGAGNEINGLTLGGVGNATIIDHVEVVGNLDDGIECFGGAVNLTDVAVVYQGDDAIDLDQNYSGTIKNFIIVMGGGDGDEGLEIDGPENSTYTDGLFTLENGTIISEDGTHAACDLKSKAQGQIINCSFDGFVAGKMIRFRENYDADNGCADKSDALDRLFDGLLKLQDCEYITSAASAADVADAYTKVIDCESKLTPVIQDEIDMFMANTNNQIVSAATKGADLNSFSGWSWSSIKGIF